MKTGRPPQHHEHTHLTLVWYIFEEIDGFREAGKLLLCCPFFLFWWHVFLTQSNGICRLSLNQ